MSKGIPKETDYIIKFKKLDELSIIIRSNYNDYDKAFLMRRIYNSSKSFKEAYYCSIYSLKNKKLRYVLDDTFTRKEETIKKIEDVYLKYEKMGLISRAKENDKFMLRQAGNKDSREIIISYINDPESYDKTAFLHKQKIRAIDFDACVSRIKNHAKDIYEEYLKTEEINRIKRLVVPMYNIFQIIEGINTGKTIEGKKFDKYEFYKLAPFKEKDFDSEIRYLTKDYPKLSIFKKHKQEFKSKIENVSRPITYADNLYLFTCCFTKRNNADLLKNWMEENDIKNLTPIFRSATINCYLNVSDEELFGYKDAKEIFDIMKENEYPKIYEVYNMLKEDTIKRKKLIKENK